MNYTTKRKNHLRQHDPYCIFCGHYVGEGDLAHKIRRSESSKYIELDKNNGLAHRECHFIFDNDLHKAVKLPNFRAVMQDIKEIDEKVFNKIILNLEKNGIQFSL